MKICAKCSITKKLDDFHAYKRSPDGKRSVCKACRSAASRTQERHEQERRWRLANPDKVRAKTKRRYQKHRDRLLAQTKAWVAAHPEYVRTYAKDWRIANREKVKADGRAYGQAHRAEKNAYERDRRKTNPEWEKSKRHTRRARLRTGGRFSPAEWCRLCDFYGRRCLACGCVDAKLTPDHVLPLCKGGTNTIDNIQPLCLQCNLDKHRKHIDYRQILPDWFTVQAA